MKKQTIRYKKNGADCEWESNVPAEQDRAGFLLDLLSHERAKRTQTQTLAGDVDHDGAKDQRLTEQLKSLGITDVECEYEDIE